MMLRPKPSCSFAFCGTMGVMCGRYVSVKSSSDLVTLYGASALSADEIADGGVALPSFNVAPTQTGNPSRANRRSTSTLSSMRPCPSPASTNGGVGPTRPQTTRTDPRHAPRDRVSAWLDPTLTDPAEVARLLADLPPAQLEARAVSARVGNVGNDSADLIEASSTPPPQPLELAYT